jgi:hypothetical protein
MDKQRQREGKPSSGSDEDKGSNMDKIKQAGDDLLAAGDEAIKRALSGNSEAFLKSTRQSGGE